jgi:ribosomal protein L40E
MALCVRCGVRWSQSQAGLCRRCERESGVDDRTLKEREAAQVAAMRARVPDQRDVDVHPPWRVLVLDDLEFWVVWDGSDRFENPLAACERFRLEGVT